MKSDCTNLTGKIQSHRFKNPVRFVVVQLKNCRFGNSSNRSKLERK